MLFWWDFNFADFPFLSFLLLYIIRLDFTNLAIFLTIFNVIKIFYFDINLLTIDSSQNQMPVKIKSFTVVPSSKYDMFYKPS